MSTRIQHPTESTVRGPFLIDRAQLESLDEIIDAEWRRLEAARQSEIAEEAASKYKELKSNRAYATEKDEDLRQRALERADAYPLNRTGRMCVLTLKDGRSAHLADFSSALRDPQLSDQE